MIRFLLWRLVQSVIVLWAVYTVTFFLLMMTPGDPFVSGDKRPPQAVLEALASKYGLSYLVLPNRAALPLRDKLYYASKAYGYYLKNLLHGDLGPSIEFENWTVAEVIRESLPKSLALGSMALLIALWLGVAMGTWGAVHKGKAADAVLSVVSLLGVSLPTFVVGLLLVMLFAVVLPVLPPGGWGTGGGGIGGALSKLLLPAFTLAAFFLAYIARLARANTLDVLSADFVRTARAKGLRPRAILIRHVGANAALPILSYLGPAAANVLVGSFVVEKLFTIPGLGQHFVQGCLNKDIPMVLGAVLVYSAMVLVFNLMVDLAYAFVDPRIAIH